MNMNAMSERLFKTLSHPNFLSMKGLANEVPIFIQTYEPTRKMPQGGWWRALRFVFKISESR